MIILLSNNLPLPLNELLRQKHSESLTIYDKPLTKDYILNIDQPFFVSYNYKHIIKPDCVSLIEKIAVNLHISMLPWNRGAHPNIWSFLKDTPKGFTIHRIDNGLDTGNILLQEEVLFVDDVETLSSTYQSLHAKMINSFLKNFSKIRAGLIEEKPQVQGGSYQSVKDFETIKHLLAPEGWDISIALLKKRYETFIRP